MDVKTAGTLTGTTTVVAKVASMEKDRVTYNLPDHTAKEPRVVIANRTLPNGNGDSGVLKTGFKVVFGDRNVDGTARSGNVIIEATIRTPGDQPTSLTQDALDVLVAILRDSAWMDDNIEDGAIPFA
jgi:hypothetical protein